MRLRIVTSALLLAACVPSIARAQQGAATALPQREGTFELSVGASGTYLDRQLQYLISTGGVANPGRIALGGVASLGYHLTPSWSVAAGTAVEFGSSVTVYQPFGTVSWSPSIDMPVSPFVSVGAGVTSLNWKGFRATGKYGVNLGAGLHVTVSENLVVRIEAREQYESFDHAAAPLPVFNGSGSVGLSWFLGRRESVAGVEVSPAVATLRSLGATQQLAATPADRSGRPLRGHAVTWSSSDDAVATVSATGLVTARSAGAATITAASGGVTGAARVTVSPAPAAIAVAPASTSFNALSQTRQLAVSGRDANGNPMANPAVTWTSSDAAVASVSPAGLVTATGNGTAAITAATADGRTAVATIYVAQSPVAVTVAPPTATIDVAGGTVQFIARELDAGGSTVAGATFTWTSDAPRVATVSPSGLAAAVGNGTAHITATSHGQTGSATLAVALAAAAAAPSGLPAVGAPPVVLTSVDFRPNSARLPPGSAAELNALAAKLRAMPNARWEIGGHTSSMGRATTNLRLSRLRALTVRRYLIGRGVPARNLVARGYGSSHPLASNATVAGRRENMRVEIRRLR
jgi:outer membrane protein OmpA-like peptidoglycan-associated protein